MKPLYELTIEEASKLLVEKEISARELAESCIARIEEREPVMNAYITTAFDQALNKAKEIDEKRAHGEDLSPLAGIPYSLKDTYNTEGIQTTAGSKILEGYISPYDATVHKKLQEAGAILLGKTNCDPFGFGSSTENSAYGVTKNPYSKDHVAGGSSGGSGCAVSYGGGLFSIGEDTGGSIRCPASFCNVVGLKPTYGLVSRYGSIAYASSYDTVGALTKTAYDNAMVTKIIAGHDAKDATSMQGPVRDFLKNISTSLEGKTIGIPKEYFTGDVNEEVSESIKKSLAKFETLGCKIVEVSIPSTKYAIAAYYVVGISEASSNLGRMEGIRFGLDVPEDEWQEKMRKVRAQGFGDEAKRRIMIGTFALSSGYADKYYHKAQKVRQKLRQEFQSVLDTVDIIATPTMPVLPFKIGENIEDPLTMWLLDAFTVSINPVGVPALSVPSGFSKEGLPIGMQLIAPHFREDILFNFGHMLEIS